MKKDYLFDVYMLCPVRNATDEEVKFLLDHKRKLEERGLSVHYPADTPQEDSATGGYRICRDHCNEILGSRASHIYWNETSTGSKVDLGSILIEHHRRGMDALLLNRPTVEKIVQGQKEKGINKSYEMVLLYLDNIASSYTRVK